MAQQGQGTLPRQGTGAASCTHILPLGADVTLGSPDATAALEQEGTSVSVLLAQGTGLGAGDVPRGHPGHSPFHVGMVPSWGKGDTSTGGGVTYQFPLVTSVPRWSLGAFPALEEGGEEGLSRAQWDPRAPRGEGAPTGRPAAPMLPTMPL